MKKVSLFGVLSISLLIFGACDGGEQKVEKNIDASVEKVADKETSSEKTSDSKKKEDIIKINQEVTNNDNFKASLIEIKHIVDKEYDEEKYIVSFDVENKRADTITVQARELSIDDRMVDEGLVNMSTDVSPGKSATAELTIEDYSRKELPKMEGNLEMLLHVFNESLDTEEFSQDEPVSVAIK